MAYVVAPDVVITIFAYLHIISAMGWLGGAILFVSAVAPSLRVLSPAASLEFMAKAVPRLGRYFILIATSTVIFGPALLLTIPDYSPYIYVGVATGLSAYVDAILTVRQFTKVSKMAKEMMKGGQTGPTPAEFQKALRIGGIGTLTIVILLMVTLMFMVYSGYPF